MTIHPPSDPVQAIRELDEAVTDMVVFGGVADGEAQYEAARERYTDALVKLSSILSALGSSASPSSTQTLRFVHDCEAWAAEGMGCAQCNPAAIESRHLWENDPVRLERDDLVRSVQVLQGELAIERQKREKAEALSTAGSPVLQPSEGLEAIRKRLQERLPLMREGAYLIALTRSDVEAILSALMSSTSPSQSEAEKALACINCGEANDGGYETGREGDPDEGAVGPFCSECWSLLREDAKIESSELERLVLAFQHAYDTNAPVEIRQARKALLAWGKGDPSSPAGTVEDP